MQQPIVGQLKADLKVAMKEKQPIRVSTLRTILSALDNATAVPVDPSFLPLEGITPDVPRRELSEEDQLAILRKEAQERRAAAEQYQHLGKQEESARLWSEYEVIAAYLGDIGR